MQSIQHTGFWDQWQLLFVLALIAAVASNFAFQFVRAGLELRITLDEAIDGLRRLKAQATDGAIALEEVQSQVMHSPRMAHLWSQYTHCLHVPWDQTALASNGARSASRVQVLSEMFFAAMKAKSGGTVVDMSNIEQQVANDPHLSDLWAQYSQALDTLGQEPEPTPTRARRWRASALSETFFSEHALVDSPLRSDFYKHLPGILTGLGIIGTFSGLIMGLVHFDVSNPESTQAQLSVLVQTVGQAFFVSALAISLAMLFTWIEKALLTARYAQVEILQNLLDSMFEAGSGQENLERLVVATEAQVTMLSDLLDAMRSAALPLKR
jgi:hypothetical protein